MTATEYLMFNWKKFIGYKADTWEKPIALKPQNRCGDHSGKCLLEKDSVINVWNGYKLYAVSQTWIAGLVCVNIFEKNGIAQKNTRSSGGNNSLLIYLREPINNNSRSVKEFQNLQFDSDLLRVRYKSSLSFTSTFIEAENYNPSSYADCMKNLQPRCPH